MVFSGSTKFAQASLWYNTGRNIWNCHEYLEAICSIYLYFKALRKFCDTLKIAAASSLVCKKYFLRNFLKFNRKHLRS